MSRRRSRRRRRNRQNPRSGVSRFIPQVFIGLGALAIGLAVFFIVSGRGASADYEPEYTGGPRIDVDQEMYDYGYVKLNTTITTDVKISNVGDRPLRITSIPQVQVLEGC